MKKGYISPEALAKLKSLGVLGKTKETNCAMGSLFYDMPFAESSSPPDVLKRVTLIKEALGVLRRYEIAQPSAFSDEIARALKEVAADLEGLVSTHERAANEWPEVKAPTIQ